jgi:hypothetical protein
VKSASTTIKKAGLELLPSAEELKAAESALLRAAQAGMGPEQLRQGEEMALDEDGVMRLVTRMGNSELEPASKSPILLLEADVVGDGRRDEDGLEDGVEEGVEDAEHDGGDGVPLCVPGPATPQGDTAGSKEAQRASPADLQRRPEVIGW